MTWETLALLGARIVLDQLASKAEQARREGREPTDAEMDEIFAGVNAELIRSRALDGNR
jgi:hypothetical protein